MKMSWRIQTALAGSILLLGGLAAWPGRAAAHCDGLDGPVVTAARQALERNDVNEALVWVKKQDEAEVRKVFEKAMRVRRLAPEARELADTHFFETIVRLHRAGEGAPYTGLKPAGRDLGPAIPATDRALETADVGPVLRLLTEAMEEGVRHQFAEARSARGHRAADVEAGREYVARYVPFIHYVERLYLAATTQAAGHESETDPVVKHAE